MKLAVCVAHSRDKNRLTEALIRDGFKFTLLGSTGGFLREGNVTMLIGINDDEIDKLKDLIASNCQTREQVVNASPFDSGPPGAFLTAPIKITVGGAVMFVLDVDQFHRC